MTKLSVIIPVYNEKETVGELLRRVAAVPVAPFDKEIIVVDDHSGDGTYERLEQLKGQAGFILLRHEANRGKGAAVRTALARASGDLVLLQDADLEYDPADYAKLLAAYGPETPVVYGSRYLGRNRIGYVLLNWGNDLLTWLINVLFRARLTDINTCYKLFRTDLLRSLGLESDGFDLEIEVTAKTLAAGNPIVEVPISYQPRSFAEGKKIGWRDGLKDIAAIFWYRFRRPGALPDRRVR